MNPRILLQKLLTLLAKKAINKHPMELIVVLGINGTEIIKELGYTVLSNQIKVRRIINKPWWDLSIPLSILGYKDEKRSIIKWIYMIIKSYVYLTFGPKNPSTLILNLNYSHTSTMEYWSKILNPNILILSNYNKNIDSNEKFIENTANNNGKIIIHQNSQYKLSNKFQAYKHIYLIGNSKTSYLRSIDNNGKFTFYHNKEKEEIDSKKLNFIPIDAFEFAIVLGLIKKISLKNCIYQSLDFDMPTVLSKIKTNLYKSEY
jgi:hypothetical protein